MRILAPDEHIITCHHCRNQILYTDAELKSETLIRPNYYGHDKDALVTYESIVCPECQFERTVDIKFKERTFAKNNQS